MSPANALIFGLGLFFLGLRLIGENLRRLSGSAFRGAIKRTTHSPLLGGGLGVLFGALMQSATAVTFIMVSMRDSGLIKSRAAAPIIVWCNVGLTVLAFVATLNIHPIIAYVVGGAGIVLGTIRIPLWQSLAGALLGMGLILIGLEQMSAGAAPLKEAAWFHDAISHAVSSVPLAFLAGLAAAAILQSNTGAAMLAITFAASGLVKLEQAMLLIYGANLGAIGLRLFLGSGLDGARLRLVRLEDFFCLLSGLLMMLLYAAEGMGIPLVAALVRRLSPEITTQLAYVFLFSNLIPALILSPFYGAVFALLQKIWPDKPASEDLSRPLYLSSQALNDPSTALDLMKKELARLITAIRVTPPPPGQSEEEDTPPREFRDLSAAIEKFAAQLAARGGLNSNSATQLHLLRAELSIIRHVEEGVRYYCRKATDTPSSQALDARLKELLVEATKAADSDDAQAIENLRLKTKLKGEAMREIKNSETDSTLSSTAVFEDFAVTVWTIHRLAKMLVKIQGEGGGGKVEGKIKN